MKRAAQRAKRDRFQRWRALGLALLLVAGAGFAQDGGRVGYVDMKRLLDNAPQVLAARERLAREFDAQDRELTAESGRLAELRARIADSKARPEARLDADELQTLQRQADALERSIERTRARLRAELESRTEQEIDRAWPRINDAVADYAREAGYELVIASPVVYYSGRIDITERVLERLKRDFALSEELP